MAFAVKYRIDWTDKHGQDSYRIDIEADGYGGSIIGLGHSLDGFELKYNESGWVQGFEGTFSFHINEADITSHDDDFFESEYKTFKVKFYINTVLKNVGWLKPENSIRTYKRLVTQYQVSFTDALNDLKEIEFEGFEGDGFASLLQVIKNAISFTDIDDLPFALQCNLYEDQLMVATDNLFKTIEVNLGAFYDEKEGETKIDDCFTVLEKCVKPFYCRLSQVDGYWQITNGQEYNSQRDIYAYSNLAAVSENAAYDRRVDISDFHVSGRLQLSKIAPVRVLRTTFKNRNIGINELSNGDFSLGTTAWNNGAGALAWTSFTNATNTKLLLVENDGTGDPDSSKSFFSDTFNIASVGDGEGFFHYTFKLNLKNLIYNTGDYLTTPIFYNVRLTYPDGSFIETGEKIIFEGEATYEIILPEQFPVDQLGDYFLTIFYVPHGASDISIVELEFDNIILTQNASAGETTDKVYSEASDVPGYLVEEEDLYFADGTQLSDAGVLVEGGSGSGFTSSWTRYGKATESDPLILQFARQYLNDRRGYFDKITVEGLIDFSEEINFYSILTLDSKTYRFTEYSKNYKTKAITGTLQQVDNGTDSSITERVKALFSQWGIRFSDIKKTTGPVGSTGQITTGPQTFEGKKTFNKPIKLLEDSFLTTPEDGAIEYIGDHLYFTEGGVRHQLDQQDGSLQEAVVTISSAEILALNATPKTLIAAPGAGKFIQIIHGYIYLIAGATPYSDEMIEVEYASGEDIEAYIAGFLSEAVATIKNISHSAPSIFALSQVENQAVRLKATDADPTTGNGTLKVSLLYRIVTF